MIREEAWHAHWTQIMKFMDENHRNPSRHIAKERNMINWLKANRKARNAGKMKPERAEKFKKLTDRMARLHRKKQYSPLEEQTPSLFDK